MLKHDQREKPARIDFSSLQEAVTCSACDYTRQESDRCPDWQCPGCGKAYAKVNAPHEEIRLSKTELRLKNHEFLEKKKREEKIERFSKGETPAHAGLGVGLFTMLKGLGTACLVANPSTIAIGAILAVASIGWGIYSFFS